MSTCKKRKAEERTFFKKWEETYLFIENTGNPLCLVCQKTVSATKEYNLKRHYDTLHKHKFEKYEGKERKNVLQSLKDKHEKQVSTMADFVSSQKTSLAASYEVALLLAKKMKSFREGELVKACAIKMAEAFGEEKIAEKFKTVSLSHQTIARRVAELSQHVTCKLKSAMKNCSYFSVALDESVDVNDISQLMIFARMVDENFEVQEELLTLHPLTGETKGSDIYEALNSVVSEFEGFEKCSCIVTDGAKAMVGSKTGLVGLLRANGINCITLHCVIHQEALCGKVLKMMNVMQSVVKMVNLIRGGNKSQRHPRFISFLDELDAEFRDLPLYTSIRWLSAGKVLKHFFGLRKEILSFFEEQLMDSTNTFQVQLRSIEFLCGLAFLTDMTHLLNVLNLNLQGKGQSISHLVGHVEGFRSKLVLFTNCWQSNNFAHFSSCSVIEEEHSNADFTQ